MVFFKKESNCSCKDRNEFEIKLKCIKTTLHRNYIVCISVGILVWTLATGQANSAEFSSWISFASTITSIILSVIAIFMSISGENKTDHINRQIEEAVKQLNSITKEMNKINATSKENSKKFASSLKELDKKISSLPEEVSRAVYGQNAQMGRGWDSDNEE